MGNERRRLAAAILVAAALGVTGARADDADAPRILKAAEEAFAAVRHGERVLAAAGDAGLAIIPLDGGEPRAIDLGSKALDVAARGETAYVTVQTAPGKTAVAVVDLAAGKVARTIATEAGRGIAIVGDDEVVAIGHPCRFLKPSTGETLAEVDIPDGIANGFHLREGTLHVARSYAGGVAFIDVKKRALVRVQGTEEWLSDIVALSEERAVALGQFGGLGIIELKTGRFEALEGAKGARGALLSGAEGGAAILVDDAVWLLDADGAVAARHALPAALAKDATSLAGIAAGEALVLLKDGRVALLDLTGGEKKTDGGEDR